MNNTMKTEIQETELYKQFKKALNIQHDMRPDDNPFVVACCEIAENYAKQKLNIHGIMQGLPDSEIYKWLESKKYQFEYDEIGEYRMLFEMDFPKIIRDFVAEHSGSPSVASEGQEEANTCADFCKCVSPNDCRKLDNCLLKFKYHRA